MEQLVSETKRIASIFLDALAKTLRSLDQDDRNLIKFANGLLYFIDERIDSILYLTETGRLWDAEIIMRAFTEATIRILFVCYTDAEERERRLNEYWNDLAEINSLKQSNKAKKLLDEIKSESIIRKGIAPLVLAEERETYLRKKWPKKKRQFINRKWSFSEIIFSLGKFMSERFNTTIITSAVHNYGLSSHLIHADETGIGFLVDRLQRPKSEGELLATGHACRLLSDVLAYIFIIGEALSFAMSFDKTSLGKIHELADPLFEKFNERQKEFFKTQ